MHVVTRPRQDESRCLSFNSNGLNAHNNYRNMRNLTFDEWKCGMKFSSFSLPVVYLSIYTLA